MEFRLFHFSISTGNSLLLQRFILLSSLLPLTPKNSEPMPYLICNSSNNSQANPSPRSFTLNQHDTFAMMGSKNFNTSCKQGFTKYITNILVNKKILLANIFSQMRRCKLLMVLQRLALHKPLRYQVSSSSELIDFNFGTVLHKGTDSDFRH
jgi:hypothetical protein